MMKTLIVQMLLVVALGGLAEPLQWICEWPTARAQQFELYQGEIATFEPSFRINDGAPTNLPVVTVWYQTNGMDRAWWHTEGAVFHPSNDVGAASYRFFVDAAGDGGKIYRANGTLRMLPSPGFVPNVLVPPVATIDFSQVTVLNPPWPDTFDETDPTVPEWAKAASPPTPDFSTANTTLVETIEATAPVPGNYATVSNRAMTALQSYTETDPTVPGWAKAESKPSYTAAEVDAADAASFAAVSNDVSVISTTLNAESARFVSTNFNSSVHNAEASVEVKVDGSWIVIWREMTRWDWLLDTYLPANFYDKSQLEAALDDKADRAWGFYDSHSGLYAPAGYTWVSSPKIAIAGGLAYSRTITSEGAVWVLESNGMVADVGGVVSNGFFRVSDDEGNALFEIVKGDKRTVGAQADSVQVIGAFTPTKLQIVYAVIAEQHPTLQITPSLESPHTWYLESDSSCPANVTWSGVSGNYVATVQAKSASASQLFVKAEYLVGGETYIKHVGPISVDGGILCTDGIHKVRPVYNNGTITWEVTQ